MKKTSMSKEKEFIVCAAILTTDLGKELLNGAEFVTGYRHHTIFKTFNTFPDRLLVDRSPKSQGFMTSRGRFVGREDGLRIAVESGKLNIDPDRKLLYSEDLYED